MIGFNDAYRGTPPWDIGRPQGAFRAIADAGALHGRVLDAGCGTGEHALLAASLGFDTTGIERTTNRVPIEVLTGRAAFFEVFRRNLVYFVFGRHTGLVPYFLPGVVAVLLLLFTRHPRPRLASRSANPGR